MQFYYGDKTPLRVLDEIDFWKQQESEHTVVIRQVVTNLEMQYVEQLKNWQLALSEAHGMAVRYIEAVIREKGHISPGLIENVRQFASFACNQSMNFISFLNQMVAESQAIRNNDVAVVVIDHIRRESEYFIGILTTALQYF